MSEISKIAKDAATAFELDHFGNWPGDDVAAVKFQGAIDKACVEKDKEIAELRRKIATDYMAGVVIEKDKEIAKLKEAFRQWEDARKAWLIEFDRYKMRLADARVLIEKIGTVAVGNADIIQAAQYWLEGKP